MTTDRELPAETVTFQPPLTITSTLTQVHFSIDLDKCPAGGVTSGESPNVVPMRRKSVP